MQTNMIGFTGYSGRDLSKFSEANFNDIDPLYGKLFYRKFKKFTAKKPTGSTGL